MSRISSRIAALVPFLAAGLLAPESSRAAEVKVLPLRDDDHYRHPRKETFYTETWNYQMLLDSGQLVYLSFMVTNIGVFSGTAGVHVTLATTSGPEVFLKDEGRPADWQEDRAAGRMSIGGNSVVVQGLQTRIALRMKRLSADLDIAAWMPGFRAETGRIDLDRAKGLFHATVFEIPRGDVRGTLALDGAERSVKGAVYMDHAVQNTSASDFSRRWNALRAFYPDHTVALLDCRLAPGYGDRRWSLGYVTDRTRLLAAGTYDLAPSGSWKDPKGYDVPTDFGVSFAAGGAMLAGSYRNAGLLNRAALLEQLSWAERKVVSVFAGNPIVYRHKGDAPLELDTGGTKIPLRGASFYEVSILADEPK